MRWKKMPHVFLIHMQLCTNYIKKQLLNKNGVKTRGSTEPVFVHLAYSCQTKVDIKKFVPIEQAVTDKNRFGWKLFSGVREEDENVKLPYMPQGPMLNKGVTRRPFWISNRQTITKLSTGPPNYHLCKLNNSIRIVVSDMKIFFKFGQIRKRNWPWLPCWIFDRHQFHKSGKGLPA